MRGAARIGADVASATRRTASASRLPSPIGNEPAIRVATAVATVPHRFPPHMVPLYAYALPVLIAGLLPTTPQAQAIKHYLDGGGDLARLRRARSFDEAYALAMRTR